MKFQLLYLVLAATVCSVASKHWGLIVAGSNGWYNYRHQADACHAYQVLHKHGIPDENIVVMMYDDIANDRHNPTPGIIINKPNGKDVYHGVVKDYTHMEVTPKNFLHVLKGEKDAVSGIGSGKVIDSGPDDNVFVYFTDHGAPNIIAFPDSELNAKDLNEAITYMHENKKYKKMVFYIEACESGSMFNRNKLPSNINVFATTAANGVESSYAVYWDNKRQTYLGDVYSVKWLENSDIANFQKESLEQQFDVVRDETNTSHVQQFGDMSMRDLVLGLFQGEGNVKYDNTTKASPPSSMADAVPAPDVPLMILYHQLKDAKTKEEQAEIMYKMEQEQVTRKKIRHTMKRIVQKLVTSPRKQRKIIGKPAEPEEEVCYKHAVTKFRKHCFNFNKYEYALRHIYVLANLCDAGLSTESILAAVEGVCPVAH